MEDKLKMTGVLSAGYGIIPKMLMKDKDLTIEAKAIYAYIASYAGNGSTAFPSISLICTDLDIGEKRFHVHKKTLIEKGYIKVEQERGTRGKFNRNVYTINSVLMPMTAQDVVEPTPQNDTTVNESPTGHSRSTAERSTDEPTSVDRGTNNNSSNNNSFINNSSNKKESRKPAKRIYDASTEYYELSKFLFEKMLENNPEAKEPDLQVWADHIRKMMELDGRSYKQVRNMIEWSQKDSFWKGNILSTKKLREKYDQMKVQALEEMKSKGNKSYRGNAPKVEVTPEWAQEGQTENQNQEEELMSVESAFEFQLRLLNFRGEDSLPDLAKSFDENYGEGTFEKLYANYQKERVAE